MQAITKLRKMACILCVCQISIESMPMWARHNTCLSLMLCIYDRNTGISHAGLFQYSLGQNLK